MYAIRGMGDVPGRDLDVLRCGAARERDGALA
jgi:hypothetical protein